MPTTAMSVSATAVVRSSAVMKRHTHPYPKTAKAQGNTSILAELRQFSYPAQATIWKVPLPETMPQSCHISTAN